MGAAERRRRFQALAYGWSSAELARLVGASRRTVKRWKAGATAPPESALRLVELVTAGELGALHPRWRGWRLARDGRLYGEHAAAGLEPGDVGTLHWLRQARAWREAIYLSAAKSSSTSDAHAGQSSA